MKALHYTIVKSEDQYDNYCKQLEHLLTTAGQPGYNQDEVDLLTLLIEKWDAEHNSTQETDPVSLLKYLIEGKEYQGI